MLLFSPDYTYPIVFGLIVINEMGISPLPIPFPSETTLLFAGYVVSMHKASLITLILIATSADILGSFIVYIVVRFLREHPLVAKLIAKVHKKTKFQELENRFKKKGVLEVFIGRLFPYFRFYTSIVSGVLELPIPQYLIGSFCASLIWCATLISLGNALSKRTIALITWLREYPSLDLGLFAFTILVFIALVVKFLKSK